MKGNKNELEKLEEQQIFDLNVGFINKSAKITFNQMVNILEALNCFINDLKELKPEGIVQQKRTELKIKESEKLFELLQEKFGYNFEQKCEKCQRALHKKKDDIGGDAMTMLVNGYNK